MVTDGRIAPCYNTYVFFQNVQRHQVLSDKQGCKYFFSFPMTQRHRLRYLDSREKTNIPTGGRSICLFILCGKCQV